MKDKILNGKETKCPNCDSYNTYRERYDGVFLDGIRGCFDCKCRWRRA
jgi:hypothetical protein